MFLFLSRRKIIVLNEYAKCNFFSKNCVIFPAVTRQNVDIHEQWNINVYHLHPDCSVILPQKKRQSTVRIIIATKPVFLS